MIRRLIASRLRKAANRLDPQKPLKLTGRPTALYSASTSWSTGTFYSMHPRRDKP